MHVIGIPVVFLLGVWVGWHFGAKAVAAAKAELVKVKAELAAFKAKIL